PHVGLLLPLALIAYRNWRALVSATLSCVFLGAAAAVAFGYQQWPSFIYSLFDRHSIASPDGRIELRLQSVFGLLHWAGANAWISWTVHVSLAAMAALWVYAVWAKPIPHSLKAASLSVASL